MPKTVAPRQILQLIAPMQVELLRNNVTLDQDSYNKGDIVTVEKYVAVNMVRNDIAKEASGEVDPERSANPYTVVKTQKAADQHPAPVTEAAPVVHKVVDQSGKK